MPADMVCEGVTENKNIFQGMKFLVLVRTTGRKEYIEIIQKYGGCIAKTEKNADIIVTNPGRKGLHHDTISIKFIDDSVKNGYLQDIDQYRIFPLRSATSNSPPRFVKKTKTQFTEADDQFLLEWCLKAQKEGKRLHGNQIFESLEKINKRHTAQSWRCRWVKNLRYRQQDRLDEVKKNHPDDHRKKQKSNSPGFRSKDTAQNEISYNDNQIQPKQMISLPTKSNRDEPQQYNHFNKKQTGLLDENYEENDDMAVKPGDDKSFDVLTLLNESDLAHTAQELRHTSEYMKPRKEVISKKKRNLSERNSPMMPRVTAKKRAVRYSMPPNSDDHLRNLKFHGMSSPQRSQQLEIMDSQNYLGDTPILLRAQPFSDPMLDDEVLFKQGLKDLAAELDLEVNFFPIICGQKISLMKLWQTVQQSEFGGYDRISRKNLWQNLAEKLGFDNLHASVSHELRECYREILADFENLRHKFLSEIQMTGSHRNYSSENQDFLTTNRQDEDLDRLDTMENIFLENENVNRYSDDLDFPQPLSPDRSKLHISSRKRSSRAKSLNRFIPKNKHRASRGQSKVLEIPSTPENIINVRQTPPLAQNNHSPSQYKKVVVLDKSMKSITSRKETHLVTSIQQKSSRNQASDPEIQTVSDIELDPKTSAASQLNSSSVKSQGHSGFDFPVTPRKDTSGIIFDSELKSQDILVPFTNEDNRRIMHKRYSLSKSLCLHSDIEGRKRKKYLETPSQNGEIEVELDGDELDEFISDHVINLGCPQEIVIEALEATSMSVGPGSHIEYVIDNLMNGEGIPEDISGVWTKNDDDALKETADHEEYKRILKKHGVLIIQLRKNYWNDMEDVE